MRVLFTAYGGHGHVLPLMGVARALAGDGHEVLVATAPDLCPFVASRGVPAEPAGMTDGAAVAEAHHRWPETRSTPAGAWTLRMFCQIAAPAMAADVGPLIDRWRPHVVVREEGEHGGPVAAAVAGVPWVTHAWGSPLPARESLVELGRLVAPAWQRPRLNPPTGTALYGAAVLDPCPPSLYLHEPALPARHAVRPTLVEGTAPAGNPRPTRRRLAYVGFGTVPLFRPPPDLVRSVVDALLALDFDVTVSTGDAEVACHLEAVNDDRVRVQPWVDLTPLLRSCDLVVCHGGAGTVLAALAAGVPLLLLPRGAPSQLRTSEACEARGVGRAVIWNGTNADEVAAALSEVTSSERMSAAALNVAEEIAAMPDPSTAAGVLHAVVASVG